MTLMALQLILKQKLERERLVVLKTAPERQVEFWGRKNGTGVWKENLNVT